MGIKLFRSSAGSGKTFALVLEYLTLLYRSSSPSSFRHILALTFTRKATAEMKQRIVRALQSFQSGDSDEDSLKKLLVERVPMTEAEFQAKSKNIYRALIHQYDQFNVTTIDGFLVGMVRAFGPELNVRSEASIELNTEKVRYEATEKLLKKSATSKELSAVLLKHMEELLNKERSWRFDRELLDFSKLIHDSTSAMPIRELSQLSIIEWDKAEKQIFNITNSLETELRNIGETALHIFDGRGIEKNVLRDGGVLYGFFKKLTETAKFKELNPRSPKLVVVFEEDKWYSAKATSEDKWKIDQVKPEVIELFRRAESLIDNNLDEYLLAAEIRKKIHQMLLLRELAIQEELWKEEQRVVLLKDIEQLFFRLLSEDDLPFIYERIGNEIRHILIDEFQDTSQRQWTNLLPLILESVSKGGEVTIVGDAKQAIYRWRGGDSSLINALPLLTESTVETFNRLQTDSLKHYLSSETVLGNNYRSSPHIVAFNNAVFEKIEARYPQITSSTYRDVHQSAVKKDPVGFVDFRFNTGESTKEAFQIWAKSQLLDRLEELKSRGFRGNDIAILVRKGDESEMILTWLNEAGVPAVSPDSLLLQSSPQVRLLVDLVKWLTSPPNAALNIKVYLQLAANKEQSNISAGPIHRIAQANNSELEPSVFMEVLKEMGYEFDMNRLRSLPPFGQILELIHSFKLDTSSDSLLQSWLNIVHNECLTNNRSLSEILEMWEWNKSGWRLESIDSVEAVNVLTIHKAKGLAWPVVLLYHFNWRKTGNNVWVKLNPDRWILPYAQISESCQSTQVSDQLQKEADNKFLDELNTFYVAFTRPKYELHGLINNPDRNNGPFQEIYQGILDARDELDFASESSNGKLSRISFGQPLSKEKEKSVELETHQVCSQVSEYQSITSVFRSEVGSLSEQAKLGMIIHSGLSQFRTPEEFKDFLVKNKVNGNISEHDLVESERAIDRLWSNGDFRSFFDSSTARYPEREFVDHQGNILRPDLVLNSEGTYSVVDFKTGKPREEDKEQVHQYKQLLEEITGNVVNGYLVYFYENRVEEVM